MKPTSFSFPRCVFLVVIASSPAYLFAQQLIQDEITEADLSARVIDQLLPVGVVAGAAAVGATGAAGYSIPVQVPPGTNGMQPDLSIIYNSQGGDGVLGWGWSISGLSAITRTGTDWYHDGVPAGGVKGITYTSSDRFALDGQRLVPGAHGQNLDTYDTEDASFSRITAVGSGPDYFTVVTKDGRTMEYGRTADSRLLGNGENSTLVWRLCKAIDVNRNYMSYTYDVQEGEHVLLRIDYTGNATAGISPYNRVQFNYASRSDKNELFVLGPNGPKTSRLLESIVVNCEGEAMKTYSFNYSERDINKSYLREVIETGSDGTIRFNSTVFKYDEVNEAVVPPEETSILPEVGHDFYAGDFDGDGRSEILAAEYANTEADEYVRYHTYLRILKRLGPGSFTQAWEMDLPEHMTMLTRMRPFKSWQEHTAHDMNGDGRDDIVLFSIMDLGGGDYEFLRFNILYSVSSNGQIAFVEQPSNGFPPPTSGQLTYDQLPSSRFSASGDFNGDGIGDVLLVLSGQYGEKAFWYSPAAGIVGGEVFFNRVDPVSGVIGGSLHSFYSAAQLLVVDMDGDGQDEIMCVPHDEQSAQGMRIFKWSKDPYPAFWMMSESVGFPTEEHDLFQGDFNGDGKTDLLSCYAGNNDWNISYSTGDRFAFGEAFDQFNYPVDLEGDDRHVLTIADFNGDGRSDICHARPHLVWEVAVDSHLDLFYSRGLHSGFEERSVIIEGVFDADPALITDLNGDGRAELVNTGSETAPLQVHYVRPGGHERSLEKVADGMNSTVAFSYGFATQNGENLAEAVFDYPKGQTKLPVETVIALSVPNGLGGINTTSYVYRKATLDRRGIGFLGYQERQTNNGVANARHVVVAEPHADLAKLLPAHETLYRLDEPGVALSHTDLIYDCPLLMAQVLGAPPVRLHLTRPLSTITYDDLAGTWTAVTNTGWDNANGNITLTTTNTFNIETVVTSIPVHVAAGPSSVLAKPEEVTVTRTRAGEASVTKTTRYTYLPATGNVWMTREFSGTAGNVLTTYEYNSTGTVRNKAVSALSVPADQWPSEKFRYEPYHRFVSESTRNWWTGGGYTDVTTITATDPKWGKPLSVLSPDGLTTSMRYDAFGRLERTDIPHIAGTPRCSELYHLDWALDGGEYYVKHTEDPGGADTWTYHDLLGRAVRTVAEGFGGEHIHASTTYDARGNMATETSPHKDGEDYLTTTHVYDLLNRPSVVSDPLTGTVTRTYGYANNELTVTTVTPSGTATSTTDAAGHMVRATDAGGQLRNQYDSWGNLLTVRHGTDFVAQNAYDQYGRQTTLWTPGAGTTSYVYNAFGKLVNQIDANGNEVALRYDNLGRLTHRTGPEGTTQHVYYNLNGDINDNLMFVTGPGGVTRSYTYDAYFRLTSATSVIAGQTYAMQYAYDDCDHLIEQTYPSGLTVNSDYDATGSLEHRYWSGGTLYRALGKNGLGQLTEHEMADGRGMRRYYTHGFLDRISANGVQDLNMGYDHLRGNLSYRWDAMQLLKESFDYDGLNRLTEATLNTTDFAGVPLGANLDYNEFGYDGSVGDHTRGGLVMRSDIGQTPNESRVTAAKHINYPLPYDQPPFVISQSTQKLTYTPFLKTASINEQVGTDTYHLTYEYGPEQQRVRSVLTKNNTPPNTERVYLGDYEKQTINNTTEEIHYINGGTGLCAMIVKTGTTWRAYATYTDHLGSITEVTSADDGSLVARQNFDAWGRQRRPETWLHETVTTPPSWLYRGFTGHEHVDPFTLINMNGRMYDPNTGRMMAADPLNANPGYTQAFNRFSYANNNPLNHIDPSGEMAWFVPILIGAAVGGLSGSAMADAQGLSGSDAAMMIFGGALIGGLSGAIGGTLSPALGGVVPTQFGGLVAVSGSSAVAGAFQAAGMHALMSGSPDAVLSSAWQGGVSSLIGSAVGGYFSGGFGAFVQGASSSAISSALRKEDGGSAARRALQSGLTSWAVYRLEMEVAYGAYKNEGGSMSRRQYFGVTRMVQRAFMRGREGGGWLLKNGGIKMNSTMGTDRDMEWDDTPANAIMEFHAHPHLKGDVARENGKILMLNGKIGRFAEPHSDIDLETMTPGVSSLVIARTGAWFSQASSTSQGLAPVPYTPNVFLRYPFSVFNNPW